MAVLIWTQGLLDNAPVLPPQDAGSGATGKKHRLGRVEKLYEQIEREDEEVFAAVVMILREVA